jgi:hypothetical protein
VSEELTVAKFTVFKFGYHATQRRITFLHTSERIYHAMSIRTQTTIETGAVLKEDADANILRRKELPDGYFP